MSLIVKRAIYNQFSFLQKNSKGTQILNIHKNLLICVSRQAKHETGEHNRNPAHFRNYPFKTYPVPVFQKQHNNPIRANRPEHLPE
jgi:hypothetical protein